MNIQIKYAAKTLSEVIYPSPAVQVRINAYATKQLEGNVLLWGPNGTGKSTVARLLPKVMYGDDVVIEGKDISELLKIDDLTSYLKNAIYWARSAGSDKLFIVAEELDTQKGSFAKFWTTLDKLQSEIMLIITTNEPMMIPKSIRSRCDQIEFPALKAQQVLRRAQVILKAESVDLPDQQVLDYLKLVEKLGDLRAYMNKLDEVIFLHHNNQPLPPTAGSAHTRPRGVLTVVQGSN